MQIHAREISSFLKPRFKSSTPKASYKVVEVTKMRLECRGGGTRMLQEKFNLIKPVLYSIAVIRKVVLNLDLWNLWRDGTCDHHDVKGMLI